MQQNNSLETNELYLTRLNKLNKLVENNINPFPSKSERTHKNEEVHHKYADLPSDTITPDSVTVCGRIMSIRNSGMFIDIVDDTKKIQIYNNLKEINFENKLVLDNLDIGDFIEVTGIVRRTKRNELTINLQTLRLLAKSLQPFPDTYYGLNDTEIRYRQRYIDLIINEESKQRLIARSKIITKIRELLTDKGFLEVETPMLHPIPGGAIAKPFITHHNTLDSDLYLRIAPELYLKKLIVGGLSEKIFELNRCFRNEGISTRHNPEFTSLELYEAYADYHDMIEMTEYIIKFLCRMLHNNEEKIKFADKEIDFSGTWRRQSMIDLIEEHTGVNFLTLHTDAEAITKARELNVAVKNTEKWGKVVEMVFADKVEPFLSQPIHITDLPVDISPLSKSHPHEPRLTERFETYINGWEVANGFSELNDPIEQKARFMQQSQCKEQGDEEAHEMDYDFITSLEYAMPPTGGLGIGIDRLTMLLTDAQSIREVIAFPTLKVKK